MDLTLTPELAAFRDEVRGFLEAHSGDYATASRRTRRPG
jgi:hypothetical protein